MIWLALYLAFGAGCFIGLLAAYVAFIRGDFEEGLK